MSIKNYTSNNLLLVLEVFLINQPNVFRVYGCGFDFKLEKNTKNEKYFKNVLTIENKFDRICFV